MNDVERDLRTLFDAKSDEAPMAPKPPSNLLRRARARQVRTAIMAGLGAAALIVGSVAGIRTLVTADGTTTADQPTETTTMNGVSITHPAGWAVIDPDAAGLNGSGPETGFPRLILALSPIDTEEMLACPGMVEGTKPTVLMTLQEEPLAAGGPDSVPWPVALEPLSVESEGATDGAAVGGCYPGWEFLRAGWTVSSRTFEARVGFDPEVTDEDRRALLDAFASMTFESPATELESAVLATGSAGGEEWQLIARRQTDGLSLTLDGESFGTGTGSYDPDAGELQITHHVFGEGESSQVVVFGAVPLEVTTVEAFPAAGLPAVSVDVLDAPDEIDPDLNAFVLVAHASLPVELNAYDATGNVVLQGSTGAEVDGPVETPLPGEQVYRGRTDDCRWRINAGPDAANPQWLQLVPDDGRGSVTMSLHPGPDAPALQLGLFRCDTGGTLAFGIVSPAVHQIRWLPTSGDELLEGVGCTPAGLPEGLCFFLSDHVDLIGGGEAIALDPTGEEIGRVTFPAEAPPEMIPEHGGTYWGLYLVVGESLEEAEFDEAARQAEVIGYTPAIGEIACDDDAAMDLGLRDGLSGVAIYFATREDAEAAAALFDPPPVGIAEVTTYCLD